MAKPPKYNAEYFSHDAGMRNDPKVKALRRKFKHEGYSIYNMLLEQLTDSDHFEYDFNEVNIEILSGDFDTEPEILQQIIDYSVRVGLFKQAGTVLFSAGLKKRLQPVIDKRNTSKDRYLSQKQSEDILSVTDKTQKKVKEKKVKEKKVKEKKGKESKEDIEEVVVKSERKIENFHESELNKPFGGYPDEEKEKSCAEKENDCDAGPKIIPIKKPLPLLADVVPMLAEYAWWRNTAEHNNITPERRDEIFKIFYEQKEDRYKILYPTWSDMAENFYYWSEKYLNREVFTKLKNVTTGKKQSTGPSITSKVDQAEQRASERITRKYNQMPQNGK